MFKAYTMAEDPDQQVRQILVMPSESSPRVHETVNDQLRSFTSFLESKVADYKEVLAANSVAVFAVNYVQNRFIQTEFSVEMARLWEKMNVTARAEYNKAMEALKAEPDSEELVKALEEKIASYDELMNEIDRQLDDKIGPSTAKTDEDDELPELGVQSQTITHYVKGSAFEMVLIVVVRSFSTAEVNQHILALYNRIGDFHREGCDVFILTRGPPIGTRGGSYIKLIGVPFRKLYDEAEAVTELKAHRRSAFRMAGWAALTKMVEVSLCDEVRPPTGARRNSDPATDDATQYITQKGGTILVNRSGNILYKYIEDESASWPTVEVIMKEVKRLAPPTPPKSGSNKIQSEVSVQDKPSDMAKQEEAKKCCTIL